jgi:hypothetical protein
MGDESKPGAFVRVLDGFQQVPKVFLFLGFVVFLLGVPAGFKRKR